jgi:GTPase
VKSIHHKRTPVDKAFSGQAVCFHIKALAKKDQLKRTHFRKGMILLDKAVTPTSIYDFEAEVVILHHATTIKPNYQAVIHCGVIRQAAKVVEMNKDLLRTGDKGHIKFRFMYRPEYLKIGTTILFREGRTKGLGVVSSITQHQSGHKPQLGKKE